MKDLSFSSSPYPAITRSSLVSFVVVGVGDAIQILLDVIREILVGVQLDACDLIDLFDSKLNLWIIFTCLVLLEGEENCI